MARAWGTDPAALRNVTKAEYDEMVAVLLAEHAARQKAIDTMQREAVERNGRHPSH